jgi:hypothetical protein
VAVDAAVVLAVLVRARRREARADRLVDEDGVRGAVPRVLVDVDALEGGAGGRFVPLSL